MSVLFNPAAPKKPTSLTINSDLLEKAKNMKINISATLESALIESLKIKQREAWLKENIGAIEKYNELVGSYGLFSDEMRSF